MHPSHPHPDSHPRSPWSAAPEDVARALKTDTRAGLTAGEVSRRLAVHGANVLREVKSRSAWLILAGQFRSLLVALLAAALIAAAVFGEWVEAGAIGAVLVVNALLGFVTELKAARSMEALRKMGGARATVRRDGEAAVVSAADLVPGDVVLVEGGDVVTADLRIVRSSKLQANESTLTGESLPTGKSEQAVPADAPLAERRSMLFKGTIVTRGSAEAVVVGTGMASELGRISQLVEEAREETTPLEKRLNRLGQGLVWVTLAIATLVAGSGYAAGQDLLLIIETAIALAVAAVPEGLPVIATIALARGMHRMARENALVNRLSAVETLGATSVICTDKTGTLTENRMRVERVVVDRSAADGAPAPDDQRLRRALEIAALCNNAELHPGQPDGVGDPMEVALLAASHDGGVDREALVREQPERREVAFDPDVKMMATVHGSDPFRVAVKGAPEAVLAGCELADDERRGWVTRAEQLANDGLRVLALAEKNTVDLEGDVYQGLDMVGLVALFDPPRAEVRGTIEACRGAGVRVVMVTGDHPVTARNIARATGLVGEGETDTAVLGDEIEPPETSVGAARARLLDAAIFARVSPKQKLDLIRLHQAERAIVAMTGDGVNDAPALRKADIGVAMGGRGTAAAREAAAMVLKDDNLATLQIAIAEGRAIFDNIRNFVVYLLSCNISEVLVVALAAAAQLPLPLLPLQILFLNLVTDVFPALALGVGEGADNIMKRPPRAADEPVVAVRHWIAIVAHGAVMTASVLTAFAVALGPLDLSATGAVTVSFLTLAFCQLWHVLNMRREHSGVFVNEITRNRWVWAALALCTFIMLAAVYFAPLANVLHVEPPTASAWGLVAGMSLVPLVVGQLAKVVRTALAAAQNRNRVIA